MANLKNLKVSKISYDAIREQASATSGTMATMAYANAGATSESAPYLVRVVSDGEMSLDDLCRGFVGKTEYTYEQARYFWNALMECVAEVLNDGVHTSVEFGYWRFALEVAGSVPSANSAPGPENAVWIAVYPSAELQSVAASIETQPNLAAQPFQIKEVFGHDHTPNKVTPNRQMLVMGVALTMGGTGEKVELAKGTTVAQCPYVPREGDLNTRIRATVPYGLPKGKGYQLRITAKGKNGTDLMTISKENIEILAAPPPTITKIATSGKDGIVKGEAFDIEGDNLRYNTGDTVKAKWNAGGSAGEQLLAPTTVTATKMSFAAVSGFDALPDNTELTFEVKIGETAAITKKTTLLAKPAPVVTSVQQEGKPANTVYPNVSTTVNGTNLAGATVKLLGMRGEEPVDVDAQIISTAATEVILKVDYTTGGMAPQNFRFKVTTAGGSVEFPITWEE